MWGVAVGRRLSLCAGAPPKPGVGCRWTAARTSPPSDPALRRHGIWAPPEGHQTSRTSHPGPGTASGVDGPAVTERSRNTSTARSNSMLQNHGRAFVGSVYFNTNLVVTLTTNVSNVANRGWNRSIGDQALSSLNFRAVLAASLQPTDLRRYDPIQARPVIKLLLYA